jgi:uncharacterized membrane protein
MEPSMTVLILGLAIFFAAHLFVTARRARAAAVARLGEGPYKGLFSLVSLVGFALIVVGFGHYRSDAWVQLWTPPSWMRHLTITLMWFAFVALVAAYAPRGKIAGWLRHPMVNAVKIWATAHLLANGDLGGVVLFGAFLAYASYDRIALKARGDAGAPRGGPFNRGDALALVGGTICYVAMLLLHPILIGVPVLRF